MRRGLRFIAEEAERLAAVRGPAHVGAEKRRRGAVFLGVPGGAAAGEVGFVDAGGNAFEQVLPEAREALFDRGFRQAAIDQGELRDADGIAGVVGFDDRVGDAAGRGEDRAQELVGNAELPGFGSRQDEEVVVAGGEAALDREEVAEEERGALGLRRGRIGNPSYSIGGGGARVFRPFVGGEEVGVGDGDAPGGRAEGAAKGKGDLRPLTPDP
jgi:hypothetical protein